MNTNQNGVVFPPGNKMVIGRFYGNSACWIRMCRTNVCLGACIITNPN